MKFRGKSLFFIQIAEVGLRTSFSKNEGASESWFKKSQTFEYNFMFSRFSEGTGEKFPS